jgi:hypothetical protein
LLQLKQQGTPQTTRNIHHQQFWACNIQIESQSEPSNIFL